MAPGAPSSASPPAGASQRKGSVAKSNGTKPLRKQATGKVAKYPKERDRIKQMTKASLVYIIQFRFRQFATNGQMKKGGRQADYGTLSFGLSAAASPFIRISDATVASRLLIYCETKWRLPKARALVSVIGGAADFAVGERLLEAFSEGLSRASKQASSLAPPFHTRTASPKQPEAHRIPSRVAVAWH